MRQDPAPTPNGHCNADKTYRHPCSHGHSDADPNAIPHPYAQSHTNPNGQSEGQNKFKRQSRLFG